MQDRSNETFPRGLVQDLPQRQLSAASTPPKLLGSPLWAIPSCGTWLWGSSPKVPQWLATGEAGVEARAWSPLVPVSSCLARIQLQEGLCSCPCPTPLLPDRAPRAPSAWVSSYLPLWGDTKSGDGSDLFRTASLATRLLLVLSFVRSFFMSF